MRKTGILTQVSLILLSVFIFDSCKKGQDDPIISFRSRNNRICAQWKLNSVSGKYTNTSTQVNVKETTYSYDGSDYTLTNIAQNGTQTVITLKDFDYQMQIEKNNVFTQSVKYSYNGVFNSCNYNGYWYWLDDKKKTMIHIPLSKIEALFFDDWEVTELKHKEITLKYYSLSTDLDGTVTKEFQIVFTNIE